MQITKLTLFLFLFMLLTGMKKEPALNTNSWSIKLEHAKNALNKPGQEMGTVLYLQANDFKKHRTMQVYRYLCGYSEGGSAQLAIKNEQGKLLHTYNNDSCRFGFDVTIPMTDLERNSKLKAGKQLHLYFALQHKTGGIADTVLLAKLALKK